MTPSSKPWLLCLNLSREYVTPGRPLHADAAATAAVRAGELLDEARELGWTIIHVHSRRDRLAHSEDFSRPIQGLEPLSSEALFRVGHKSVLAHATLRARLNADRPSAIFLIGFPLAHEGLATLFDAIDLGFALRIVADAVASPNLGDRSSAEVDRTALAIAASLTGVAHSSEVLNMRSNVVVGFKGA